MIRDRGRIKWVSMMLPEHVRELKKSLIEESKIMKPILDEQEIERMEKIVFETMEKNNPLLFSIFNDGQRKLTVKVGFLLLQKLWTYHLIK